MFRNEFTIDGVIYKNKIETYFFKKMHPLYLNNSNSKN